MGGTFTQLVVVLCIFQFVQQANDPTVKVVEELVHQREEQYKREMAWLLEIEQQEQSKISLGSLFLSVCQQWWFWVSAEMLLMLFGFYWQHRQGSSGYDCSACGETPAEPKMKRRRRRKRKRMHGIADYSDKMDRNTSLDQRLKCKDTQNSEEKGKDMQNSEKGKDMQNSEEERMEEMIKASAKPFPQKTFGQSCSQGIQ